MLSIQINMKDACFCNCFSLLFLTVQALFIIRLCTDKIALKFTLLKQHIKMIVLF